MWPSFVIFVTMGDLKKLITVVGWSVATSRGCIVATWLEGLSCQLIQGFFLDQIDYLIGKLPDETKVQIRTRIRPDSNLKPTIISTSLLFTVADDTALIYDKVSSMMQLTSGANVFRSVFVPKDDILNIRCKCLRFCDLKKNQVISARRLVWSPRD